MSTTTPPFSSGACRPMLAHVWFKNRRAKWRKQKREEQERLRKLQEEEDSSRVPIDPRRMIEPASVQHFSEESSSDLEVA
ncbi:hypothetical protein YQE_12574, partial [Dendroctonus ponderosae]